MNAAVCRPVWPRDECKRPGLAVTALRWRRNHKDARMTEITTRIATSDATSITVRGRDLVNDLIGNYSFTEMTYFLIRGRMPSASEAKVLDACLITLMEHGWTPTSIIARLAIESVPSQAQVAIAAGLLAIGDVFVGTMEG